MISNNPFPCIPGTEPRARALFVDRWGTLLEIPSRGTCTSLDEATFIEGAIDALFGAHRAGWKLYLIGNEDAVASGRVSDDEFQRFESQLLEHLEANGVPIQRNYACLDHPEEGQGAHRRPSVFRLPDTGLLYHAFQVDGVCLEESWVIGDSSLELVAGERAGCRVAGVRTGLAVDDGVLEVEPDLWGHDLGEILRSLLASESYA